MGGHNTNSSKVGHSHDERYYTEAEVRSTLNNMFAFITFTINPTMNGVSKSTVTNITKDGYIPIALAGWEIGVNTATFVQRCEIMGNNLHTTVRTTSNASITAEVYFDVTILYRKIF